MSKDWKEIEGDSKEKYALYLCSPEWGRLRSIVADRSGGWCERCHLYPVEATHHLTYARKYAEHPEDLEGICDRCHKFTHGKKTGLLNDTTSIWHLAALADFMCRTERDKCADPVGKQRWNDFLDLFRSATESMLASYKE